MFPSHDIVCGIAFKQEVGILPVAPYDIEIANLGRIKLGNTLIEEYAVCPLRYGDKFACVYIRK